MAFDGKAFQTEYPRPQFVRDNWQNLNGTWNFAFDDEKVGRKHRWFKDAETFAAGDQREIVVPFTYESKASGIGIEEPHECVWYQRSFEVGEDSLNSDKKLLLHLDGSDYKTTVWVNGDNVGTRFGGQHRLTFDITDNIVQGENLLTVEVLDDMNPEKARGKQRWIPENYGCWYTQTTGLWKTVWLETVSCSSIASVQMEGDFENDEVKLRFRLKGAGEGVRLRASLAYEGRTISTAVQVLEGQSFPSDTAVVDLRLPLSDLRITPWGVLSWSPEEPNLYDLEFELFVQDERVDHVKSYYGHRKLEYDNGVFRLNGRPYFMKLILDQGYWEDSLLTCPNDDAILHDLRYLKDAGFNGLRKHQKVEDERFIYHCDREGLLVWSETAATYVYTPEAAQYFSVEWMKLVQQYRNFPSIVAWTPFNESWGVGKIAWHEPEQAFTRGIYELTHALDGTRPVISNDGWEHTLSDFLTLHDYEEDGDAFFERYYDMDRIVQNEIHMTNSKYAFAEGHAYEDQPIILSEYGGIAFATEGDQWGYGRTVGTMEAFEERLGKLHDAIRACGYFRGVCYTQLTDVQQEVNGLLEMDHAIKIPAETMRRLMDRLC